MKTVLVPTFDEFNKYEFERFVEVKIKNKPDNDDRCKITRLLPGFCQGSTNIQQLITDGKIDVRSFYDARQNTRKFKGFFVVLKPTTQ